MCLALLGVAAVEANRIAVYPETKGPSLEELAVIFDGHDAKVGVAPVEEIKADLPEGAAAIHIEEILSKE